MKESAGYVDVPVVRTHGSDGEVSVKWMTVDESAISGRDYVGGEGQIVFKDKEVAKILRVEIINDMCPEKDECFEIKLSDTAGGAKIGNINRIAITISSDDGECSDEHGPGGVRIVVSRVFTCFTRFQTSTPSSTG